MAAFERTTEGRSRSHPSPQQSPSSLSPRTLSGYQTEPRTHSQSSNDQGRRITEEQWVDRIRRHAGDEKTVEYTLYPGENYHKLAYFLNKAAMSPRASYDPSYALPFATLYQLQPDEANPINFLSEDLSTEVHLSTLDEKWRRRTTGTVNQVLFLRGFPTPEWLRKIGWYYCVDPEFFRRHLDFSLFSHQQWFSSPSLPSTSSTVVRLRVTTLGRKTTRVPDLDKARKEARESMETYIEEMSEPELQGNLGESIVRRFSLHDNQHFSLEQDISICWCARSRGWTVICWLDSGKDLILGPRGPWKKSEGKALHNKQELENFFEFISTIRNEPNCATHRESETESKRNRARADKFQQSRALLNLDYGRHFEGLEVYDDAFYTIVPIFKYKAYAESQLLNLVESVIQENMENIRFKFMKSDAATSGKDGKFFINLKASYENFTFHKELLESHVRELGDNIRSIKSRGGPEWPRSNHEKVKKTIDTLQDDFEWLQERARALSGLCDRAMQDIHDKTTLAESYKANEQAEQVNKLTRLATFMSVFYVPLSFTSGFFGMNFSSFGQGHVPLWIYPAVSVPISIVSFVFVYWDLIKSTLKEYTPTSEATNKYDTVRSTYSGFWDIRTASKRRT